MQCVYCYILCFKLNSIRWRLQKVGKAITLFWLLFIFGLSIIGYYFYSNTKLRNNLRENLRENLRNNLKNNLRENLRKITLFLQLEHKAKDIISEWRGKIERGYSLTGKTAILHIVILGSSPNISISYNIYKKLEKLNPVERNSEDV